MLLALAQNTHSHLPMPILLVVHCASTTARWIICNCLQMLLADIAMGQRRDSALSMMLEAMTVHALGPSKNEHVLVSLLNTTWNEYTHQHLPYTDAADFESAVHYALQCAVIQKLVGSTPQ